MEENTLNQTTEERRFKKILKNKFVLTGTIVLGVIIVLLLGFFALNNYIYNEKQAENGEETIADENPVLYFDPQELDLTLGEIQIPIVKIMGDIRTPADTFKLDIEYDSLTISDVQISQVPNNSFLTDAVVVTNTPNYQSGKAFFEIQTPAPVAGNGPIAILTFTPNPSSPVTTTTVTLTSKSAVLDSSSNKAYETALMKLDIILPSDSTDRANFAPDAQERLLKQQESLSE